MDGWMEGLTSNQANIEQSKKSHWLPPRTRGQEDQADECPTVVAGGRGGTGRAASHPAQLLRQPQEPLAEDGALQPGAATGERLGVRARLTGPRGKRERETFSTTSVGKFGESVYRRTTYPLDDLQDDPPLQIHLEEQRGRTSTKMRIKPSGDAVRRRRLGVTVVT
ncbi:hypothetical protein EYF80_038635 [Liparis tanakae]|uniref:Uncharacterized protein n=1 Tax=Liparis tanakae TaxID=230148 RepID=A0A4Z2GDG3_9TELE|nr:hypothetical protein EYF80_038635 [Liparis tanakae]